MRTLKRWKIVGLILSAILMIDCGSEQTSSVPGVTDTEVVIGSWGPQTGPAAPWGAVVRGMDCYFKMINDEGGLAGRNVRFVMRDDAYQPARTKAVVKEMVESAGVFAFAGGIGTAPGMAVKDYLSENSVPWIAPNTGSTHFTHPLLSNIFAIQPPYVDEGAILAQYAISELGKQKIAIFYQNDDYGKGGLAGAILELRQHNLELVETASVELMDSDLSSHALRLKNAGAEVVLLFTTPKQATILLGESAKLGFSPVWMSSLTLADMELMYTISKGLWENVIFANYIEMPTSSHPTVQKYKAAQEKYFPDERWSWLYLGGFATAEFIAEGIRRCGKNLTRENLIKAMESMKDFQSVGPNVRFSPSTRQGNRSVTLYKCKSATEYEKLADSITSDIDIDAAIQLMTNGI